MTEVRHRVDQWIVSEQPSRKRPVGTPGSVTRRIRAPDRPRAERAIREFLDALGFDVDDPALSTSSARVTEAYTEILTAGYATTPIEALGSGFPVEDPGPVSALSVPILFVCPHHLLPAQGRAHVAFLPRHRVPGLSRVTRLLDVLGRRLVLQEDLTRQVVDALVEGLDVVGAVCVIEARHGCVAVEDFARRDAVFRTRAAVGDAETIASLDAEIGANLDRTWSTSASEPPARAPDSK